MICIYFHCSTGPVQVLVRCLQRVASSVWYALTFTAAQVLFRCWSGVFREWTVVHYTFTFTVALDLFRCRSGVFREWTVVYYTFTFTATLVLFRCWSGVFREWTVVHNTFTFTAALILFRCLQRVDYSVLYAFTFNAGRISRGQVLARCVLRVGCSVYNAVYCMQHWSCSGVGQVSSESGRWGMKHWPLLHHWTCSCVGV